MIENVVLQKFHLIYSRLHAKMHWETTIEQLKLKFFFIDFKILVIHPKVLKL